jgi:excisionase family DNA binding protein
MKEGADLGLRHADRKSLVMSDTVQQKEIQPLVVPTAYNIEQAAALLNVSTKTVRRLIDRGLLRKNKTLGRILIPKSDVEKFHEKNSEFSFDA